MTEIDISQGEQSPEAIIKKENLSSFHRIQWTFTHGCIALGVLILFRIVFLLFRLMDRSVSMYVIMGLLWILMFCWMIVFPVWVARSQKALRKPLVTRILKEFGLAIPIVICFIIVEGLIISALQKVNGDVGEVSSALSRLPGVPHDIRLYFLLIPMFTLGPIAEELFFRGFLYNALRQRLSLLKAIILQAFVFALIHYRCPWTHFVELLSVFIAGVVLAGVYTWRKTLWSPIATHALKNFVFVGPVIVLMILNNHTPAQTWQEAERPPDWLTSDFSRIERKATGEEQRLYAINTWGSEGLRLWKKEIQCFEAVCHWFPDDREACSRARIGIAEIYQVYLRDFRRSVVESNRILSQFKDRPEDCADALIIRGWSYYDLGEHEKSRVSFQEVVESYASYEWAREAALIGLKELDDR